MTPERLIRGYFSRVVKKGALTITYASGRVQSLGDGSGDPVAVRFTDKGAEWAMLLNPALAFGEMYMDGRFVIDKGTLFDFVAMMKVNGFRRHMPKIFAMIGLLPHLVRGFRNVFRAAAEQRQVAHHYDLDGRLFALFLDKDWQYSCALFENEAMTLDEAQLAKKRHLTAKLMPEPGDRVLDIGSGWGGMALYLAELTGTHVTGITLSEEQVAVAKRRAVARGLVDETAFRLQNYRDVTGSFERIISIGMLEHVGKGNYHIFFRKAFDLLEKKGVMVVHSIGRPRPVPSQGAFNEKYIFPGGYIPAISEVVSAIQKAGFLIKDIEILPMHYAWTLKEWRRRFMQNRDEAARIYDERFCRMWEFYLAVSETAFSNDRLFIMQLQLAKFQDAVPFTRDYLAEAKTELRRLEAERLTHDDVVL